MRCLILALPVLAAFATAAPGQEPLPDYVIAEFGQPPTIPEGSLSPGLLAAVQAAFVDTAAQASWGAEQIAALEVIAV